MTDILSSFFPTNNSVVTLTETQTNKSKFVTKGWMDCFERMLLDSSKQIKYQKV